RTPRLSWALSCRRRGASSAAIKVISDRCREQNRSDLGAFPIPRGPGTPHDNAPLADTTLQTAPFAMRVQLVDPSAFTPPYDRALAAALARRGAEVELVTTKFLYGPVPEAEGYSVDERFYRRTASRGLSSSARLPFKGAEHLRDMLAFKRAPSD